MENIFHVSIHFHNVSFAWLKTAWKTWKDLCTVMENSVFIAGFENSVLCGKKVLERSRHYMQSHTPS